MFERLDDPRTRLYVGYIGLYETGTREPPLKVLLRYARAAGVCVDVLIDDDLDLPLKMPSTPQHSGVGDVTAKLKSRTRSKSKNFGTE